MVDRILPGLAHLSLSIDSLHPDPSNARKHSQRNLDAIKASLAKFGQRKAIVVQRDGMIVRAGNGTLEAAKALGWDEIAALVIDEDNVTAAAFAIADNRTAELAEWDATVLAELSASLLEDGWDDLESVGFSAEDLEEITGAFDVAEVSDPNLPEGNRKGIQQMTFHLTDDQVEEVKEALKKAKSQGAGAATPENDNSNGNALAHICGRYNGPG